MAIFIGRRPEAGFTRVPNDWARDPKLSFKAKGLLTYLLSHQDGYRLTVEQVVAEATDGKSAVYSAIKELVEHGYLERVQRRGERGKVGEVDYYVADAPGETASGLSASRKPESGDELGKQEEAAGGTAFRFSASGLSACGESTTKKTRVKKTKVLEDQNTISLSGSADSAAASNVPAQRPERETANASQNNQTDNPIHRLLLEAGCPPERLTDAERWITEECQPRGLGWWRKTAGNGDLKVHVAAFLEAGPTSAACTDCDDTGQTGDWMNPHQCPCIWRKDPGAARKAFVAQLKDFPDCDHGVAGGDLKAPDGWQYCALCRGPGWVDPNVQSPSDGFRSMFNRSPADRAIRDAQPLYEKYKRQEQNGSYVGPSGYHHLTDSRHPGRNYREPL